MFDPTPDFPAIADGLRPVTLVRPGTDLSIEVPDALRRAVLRRDTLDSDGRYTASDFVWHLPARSLTESPRAGDILVDDSGSPWTILGARPATFGSRWHCVCRNLIVAHGLSETVDIQKAAIAKTDAGAEQLSWQPWLTDLAARIQPHETTLKPSEERTETVNLFRIYLLEDVEIDATCRVRASDGTTYRILGSRRRSRLDELMYLEVERNA
jgi:hypothetical protein